MKDIELKTNEKKFKYRVNGIIIHDGKVLALKMKNNMSTCGLRIVVSLVESC